MHCIFEGETSSSKILFLDLAECSLGQITSMISSLTETPSVIDVPRDQKKRFVVPSDYNEYFSSLRTHFVTNFSDEPLICNLVRAMLILVQNNIFYSIAKFIKIHAFYKLSWKDDVRILANTNAFKVYYVRRCINQAEKKESEAEQKLNSEDRYIHECLAAFAFGTEHKKYSHY